MDNVVGWKVKKVGSRYVRVLARIGKWMKKSPEIKTALIVGGIILAFYIMFTYPIAAMLIILACALFYFIEFIYTVVKQW